MEELKKLFKDVRQFHNNIMIGKPYSDPIWFYLEPTANTGVWLVTTYAYVNERLTSSYQKMNFPAES